MKSNFADNLKKIRKENNLSQEQLADKLGVSRQSVSKWESSAAYPEMDKVLQLCKMFNLNVDELLNQNIKELKEEKESVNKVNNYVNSFLDYITKTVKLFISMSFKDKVKCLFEQFVIIIILLLIISIIEVILSSIFGSLFAFIPSNLRNILFGILGGIYKFAGLILSLVILTHMFKVRYLDYYEIVESEDTPTDDVKENDDLNKKENNLNQHDKKIIIRDPKHSEYSFLNALLKGIILIVKFFALFIFFFIAIALVLEVFGLCISIYHISVHNLFIGTSIAITGGVVITAIILTLFYSFIFNRKISIKNLFMLKFF